MLLLGKTLKNRNPVGGEGSCFLPGSDLWDLSDLGTHRCPTDAMCTEIANINIYVHQNYRHRS